MSRSARLGALAAVALATGPAAAATVVASPAEALAGTSVAVQGRLLVAPSEVPGGPTLYGVALADGDIVAVSGHFDPDVRTGATFDGRLAVPASVTASLTSRKESGAAAALRLVDRRSLTLPVVGSPSVAPEETAQAVTPTVHQQFVAAIDNRGELQTDGQLLAHVSTVGDYWEGESNGAIAGITVPATVKHYKTALSTTDCGLGSDFFQVVQEAEAKFPSLDLSQSSPDQLVLFVPDSCSSGPVVGEGTVGDSFASGGALVVKATDAIEGTYAHETGHNYGFEHANARVGARSLEYYGVYDVMGFALDGFNQLTALSTPFRIFQGIIDPGEIQDVDLGDGSAPVHATATIEPRSDDAGVRSVEVTDPDTGENLYLDYRSGTGQDAGSFYADTSGFHLTYDNGTGALYYGPGVTINAVRGGSGEDVLANAAGHTFFGAGDSWTDTSGMLTVTVTSVSPTGADVQVDYTPPQDFATVGTPVIGGTVKVGGTVTLDTGTWSPTPTSTQVRWTADGQPVSSLDDKTQFTAGPTLVGKQLVATVTEKRPGYKPTTVQSAGVTVAVGTVSVTANPSITGTVKVGFTLHANTATWSTVLSTVTSSYQWQRDGTDIPGATSADYQVTVDDVGSTLAVTQTIAAQGYAGQSLVSAATPAVPEPVIDPAPTPSLTGTPRVGSAFHVTTGTWMTGTSLGYQWYVAGSPVAGATGSSYLPTVADLGKTVHVVVTGSRESYPTVERTSAESAAVVSGVLASAKPAIVGKAQVGKTLTARPGRWTPGTAFSYAWFANGTKIRHRTAAKLTLTKAVLGKRITVKVTGKKPGYTSVSKTSAATAKVRRA